MWNGEDLLFYFTQARLSHLMYIAKTGVHAKEFTSASSAIKGSTYISAYAWHDKVP